jgi:hypothetical protein
MVGPHHLIIKFLDTCLQTVVLLKKLSVALLNVLDKAVLGRHLVLVRLQA